MARKPIYSTRHESKRKGRSVDVKSTGYVKPGMKAKGRRKKEFTLLTAT